MSQKHKVVLIVGAAGMSRIGDLLSMIDEQGIEYEIEDPSVVLVRAMEDREPLPIVPAIEEDCKPYPERNHRKGKRKRF